MKDGIRFYDKRDNIFSYFTGYEYSEVETVDENVIAGFLNHVKEFIANGNDEMYEYILVCMFVVSILMVTFVESIHF